MADFSFLETESYKSFIAEYGDADTIKLRLKAFHELPFDKEFAIRQIECSKKAKAKIPELSESWIYPTNLSIEQCTAETIAKFHASLFEGCGNVVDFTCGLGIDSYYISQKVKSLTTVEIDSTIAGTAAYNFKKAGAGNITVVNADAETYAAGIEGQLSAAFIDQARRGKDNSRVYNINDCVPDIKSIIRSINGKTGFLIAKTSPMIDITDTLRQFREITEVWVISLKNECKELLFRFDFTCSGSPVKINTINFESGDTQLFSTEGGIFKNQAAARDPEENGLLMLPNSSVMKAGIFNELCERYGLSPIAANSHLFISSGTPTDGFPGKIYRIERILTLSKPDIKALKQTTEAANIACRNFPLTPDGLYKKLKIKNGGDYYLFATTISSGKKLLLLCKKAAINA